MEWIIAFAFMAATLYTLLNLPDYFLRMWRGNRAIVRSAMARLKIARTNFEELEEIANDYPDHALHAEINDVIGRLRSAANPTIASIHALTQRDIWNLAIFPDSSWSLGSAEFWRYWRPIWLMRRDARLIDEQVRETERYVSILDALCDRLADETIAILPRAAEDAPEPPIHIAVRQERRPVNEAVEEIATAFKFSLRQESISPVLDQIEGEQAQGMQIPQLYERGLGLQDALAALEETAWEEEAPTQALLDRWLAQLERWREDKEALANEVEQIQRRRVEHERNVRRIETKIDEFVVRESESDLTELAYDLLSFSDQQLEALAWQRSADAVQIASLIANGLPNMRAIDQNARALKQRIPKTTGATRAKLTQAVTRYAEWRSLLDHVVTEQNDNPTRWLSGVLDDVTRAFAEKPTIIQLLNDAIIAHKTVQQDDAATAAAVADVWKRWGAIEHSVSLDDHWLSQALRELPSDASEIPADVTIRTEIRNQAKKVSQTLTEISTEIQAWQTMIQQDIAGFKRDRREILEPAARWFCLQQVVKRIDALIDTYQKTYEKPQLGWLVAKREQLHAARQTVIEKIRQETSRLHTLYDTLQSEADRIHLRLRDFGEGEDYRTITAQLQKAQQARDVADARMALQSAKYALEA
jgi:hypothetical protein